MALHGVQCDKPGWFGVGGGRIVRTASVHWPHDRPVVRQRKKQTLDRAGLVLVDESHRRDNAPGLFHLAPGHRRDPRPSHRVDYLSAKSRVDQEVPRIRRSRSSALTNAEFWLPGPGNSCRGPRSARPSSKKPFVSAESGFPSSFSPPSLLLSNAWM